MDEIKIQELWVKLLNIKHLLQLNLDDLQFTDDEWDLIKEMITNSK